MKIYQTVEPVPSRVLGLVRLLHGDSKHTMDRQAVVDLLQPVSIRTEQGSTAMAEDTISAAIELGLVAEEATSQKSTCLRLSLAIGSGVSTKLDVANFEEQVFRAIARVALARDYGGRTNQFARICAWMLCQSPAEMPQGHGAFKSLLESQGFDLDELGLRNDARWDMVLYWMAYLGLLWQTKQAKCVGVIPDPSTFVKRHLDELLRSYEPVLIQQFRASLADLCPVIDGGAVHLEVAAIMISRMASSRDDDHLSPALSFALRHLRAIGSLDYWCPDDQREFLLLSGNEKIAYVSRGGRSLR